MISPAFDYLISFIDVGQGDATLVSNIGTGKCVLVDAGRFDPLPLLIGNDFAIEAILLTHWHEDHVGGLPGLLYWLKAHHKARLKLFVKREITGSKIAKRLRRAINEAKREGILTTQPLYSDFAYEGGELGSINLLEAKFIILWPPHDNTIIESKGPNHDSSVFMFQAGVFRLLLAGDAPGDVWPQLSVEDLKARMLKYPHHGGALKKGEGHWSAEDLISCVDPKCIIVSVGKNNQHGHPSDEFRMAACKACSRNFFYTSMHGTIKFHIVSSTGLIKKAEQ